ncbi:MAG: chorismate lyase [Gammaproteobacteria bacterium]
MLLTPYYTKYEPNWRPLPCFSRGNFKKNFYFWLTHAESMTKMIRTHSKNHEIHLSKRAWEFPFLSEKTRLNLAPRVLANIREVQIHCNGYHVMFARTVIPRATFIREEFKFKHLNNRPLGELLFSEPSIERSTFEIAKIYRGNYFYTKSGALNEPFLWGRRSIFYIKNKPLLLTEIFTPCFFEVFK